MAVSKRTRFEVLRRDDHTCRYCRSTDNPLTVDHVTPVALGGSDKPDNLVAACKDCNAGKSSAAPDSSLVAEVRDDAIRHAEMIRQAYALIVQRMGERDDYIDQFVEAFSNQPAPSNWRSSVGRWFEMGVPIEIITDAARIAVDSPKQFRGSERFAYMCGIVWNQAHAVTEATSLKEYLEGEFMTEDDRDQYWSAAFRSGETAAKARLKTWTTNDAHNRLLLSVVEDSYSDISQSYDEFITGQLATLRSVTSDALSEAAV